MRAGFESLVDVFVAFIGGEHDDACLWRCGANLADGVNAVPVGQAKVHERDVGIQLAEEAHGFFRGACLAHDAKTGLAVENGGDADPHQRMVVDDKNIDRLRWELHLFLLLYCARQAGDGFPWRGESTGLWWCRGAVPNGFRSVLRCGSSAPSCPAGRSARVSRWRPFQN